MSSPHSFRLSGLEKRYPDFTLGPIDLEVEPGSVLAFVGPNGSGKTTTLHCMMDLVRPTSGTIEIAGRPNNGPDPRWKEDVGFVGEVSGWYKGWTVGRNLAFVSQFYPNWSETHANALARRFGLQLNKKVGALSKGNRRKLSLVAALAHRPRVLLFDEPTSGLDPVVRADVLDVLWELLEDGEASIFYSTHVLSDISRLADELVFLREGRILGRHNKEDLLENWRRVTFRLTGQAGSGLSDSESWYSHRVSGADHQLVTSDFEQTAQVLGSLGAENVHANRLTVEEISIEMLKHQHVTGLEATEGSHVATS